MKGTYVAFILDNKVVLIDPSHVAKKGILPLWNHDWGWDRIGGNINWNKFALRSTLVGLEIEDRSIIGDTRTTNSDQSMPLLIDDIEAYYVYSASKESKSFCHRMDSPNFAFLRSAIQIKFFYQKIRSLFSCDPRRDTPPVKCPLRCIERGISRPRLR